MAEDKKTYRKLETQADSRDAALEVASIARRSLVILTNDLEPGVLDSPEFLERVKNLALGSRFATIRVLLKDSTRAIRDGHRLLELSRRLSSFVEIRKPHPDYADIAESFIVADERAVLYRTLGNRWEGIADSDDPMLARDKLKLFNDIWQRSNQDSETRRLGV